ncbi:MAG: hypothetical protein K9G67_08255 [Bacteroidales bacterium]|nr:hypothetical protein [Bacteroidales bacterium]MCF8376330.1 hypothetical protein [Bacteroidales bacterium]MCF8400496.1 hypothetical protein [Bacteroidales bacterium]
MKQIILLLLNAITLLFALVMNYLSGTGAFSGTTVGDISANYQTLFTPAGYAFGIWGLIYLLLIAFVVYQWVEWIKQKKDDNILRTGIWLAIGNIANGLWIYAWLNQHFLISVILILVLLISLIALTLRLRLETWNAPLRIIAFVWWPVCIYLGWIVVATVANITIYLTSLGWEGGFLSEQAWAVVLITAATLIYVLLIRFRNMREAALVGVWALIAIAVRQHQHEAILYASIIASVILFVYISYHGYKNRDTSPFKKMEQGQV